MYYSTIIISHPSPHIPPNGWKQMIPVSQNKVPSLGPNCFFTKQTRGSWNLNCGCCFKQNSYEFSHCNSTSPHFKKKNILRMLELARLIISYINLSCVLGGSYGGMVSGKSSLHVPSSRPVEPRRYIKTCANSASLQVSWSSQPKRLNRSLVDTSLAIQSPHKPAAANREAQNLSKLFAILIANRGG